jgi:hypothetical protein
MGLDVSELSKLLAGLDHHYIPGRARLVRGANWSLTSGVCETSIGDVEDFSWEFVSVEIWPPYLRRCYFDKRDTLRIDC